MRYRPPARRSSWRSSSVPGRRPGARRCGAARWPRWKPRGSVPGCRAPGAAGRTSSATTSPCSVILMVPSTVPHGCARIASAVGPPPRPTVPPWKSSLPYTDICLYMVRMYERMPSSQPQCTRHAMAVLPRRNGRAAQCEPCRRRPCRHDERRVARAHSLHTATSYSGTRTASHGLAAPALLRHSMQGRFDSYKLCHRVSRMCLGRMST